MERLTQDQIKHIYWHSSWGFSQREIARSTGHTRRTIAKYTNPKVIAGLYCKIHEQMEGIDEDKAMWKMIAIISLIGYSITFITVFINTSL